MRILAIIPAYNEEDNIKQTVSMLCSKMPELDYIIINDHSIDNTENLCINERYNYAGLPINLGIGGSVQCGYQYGVKENYDIMIQFDGDGQHNAEYIDELIKPIMEQRADMVIGSRFITNEGFQSSFSRRLGITILNAIIRLCTGSRITDSTSGFRAVNYSLAQFFCENYAQDYPEPESIVAASLNGFRIMEVPVIMNERVGGVSSINPIKSIYYMIKVILAIIIYRIGQGRRK